MYTPKYESQLNYEKQEKECLAHLNAALPFLKENAFLLSEFIENQELLPEYGYTTELKEEIAGLKKELELLKSVIPESFINKIEHLSLADVMELETKIS